MEVQQLPSRFEYHSETFAGVVNIVAEYYSQAFECTLLDVEIGSRICLDYLKKEGHPIVKGLRKTLINYFVLNAICPRHCP